MHEVVVCVCVCSCLRCFNWKLKRFEVWSIHYIVEYWLNKREEKTRRTNFFFCIFLCFGRISPGGRGIGSPTKFFPSVVSFSFRYCLHWTSQPVLNMAVDMMNINACSSHLAHFVELSTISAVRNAMQFDFECAYGAQAHSLLKCTRMA